jgi:hypothetical protein
MNTTPISQASSPCSTFEGKERRVQVAGSEKLKAVAHSTSNTPVTHHRWLHAACVGVGSIFLRLSCRGTGHGAYPSSREGGKGRPLMGPQPREVHNDKALFDMQGCSNPSYRQLAAASESQGVVTCSTVSITERPYHSPIVPRSGVTANCNNIGLRYKSDILCIPCIFDPILRTSAPVI